jgi:hypothetical protein
LDWSVEEKCAEGVEGLDLFEVEVRKNTGFFAELYCLKKSYLSEQLPVLLDALRQRHLVRREKLAHGLLRLGLLELQTGFRFPLEELDARIPLRQGRLVRGPLDHYYFS